MLGMSRVRPETQNPPRPCPLSLPFPAVQHWCGSTKAGSSREMPLQALARQRVTT